MERDPFRQLLLERCLELFGCHVGRGQQPQRGQNTETARPEFGAVVEADEQLGGGAVLVPVGLVQIPDSTQVDREGRIPVAHVVRVGDPREIRRQSPVGRPTRHLDHARHGRLDRLLEQLLPVAELEVVNRQAVAGRDRQILRQERVDQDLTRPQSRGRPAVRQSQSPQFTRPRRVQRRDRRVGSGGAILGGRSVGQVSRDLDRLRAALRRRGVDLPGQLGAENDLGCGDQEMLVRRREPESEVRHLGVATDEAFDIGRRGFGIGGRPGIAIRPLPDQQRVHEVAAIKLPLQIAQAEIADERLALVRGELEAARTLVLQHRDHAQPHALQLVCGVLLAHQACPRRLGRPLQVEHHGVARFDGESRGEGTVDRQRREQLTIATGQVEGLLHAREEGREAVVDALDVHPGRPAAALRRHHAAPHQNRRRHRAVPRGKPGVIHQLIPQPLAEEARAEQRMIDAAETVQGQVAQAAAHRVAHHQGAGEHRRRHRRGQHHGDVRAPVVPQTGQGSAGSRRTHGSASGSRRRRRFPEQSAPQLDSAR